MKYSLKSIFKHDSQDAAEKESDQKVPRGIDSDTYGKIVDEDYVVKKQYAQNGDARSEEYASRPDNVVPDTPTSPQRRSMDVSDSSQIARKPLRNSQQIDGAKRISTDNSRGSIDLVDAANQARVSRGENRLPAEPERVDILNPGRARRTSIGSSSRYDPPGGDSARSSAATEMQSRRASKRLSKPSANPQLDTPVVSERSEDIASGERSLASNSQASPVSSQQLKHSNKTSNDLRKSMVDGTEQDRVEEARMSALKQLDFNSNTPETNVSATTFDGDKSRPIVPTKSNRRSLDLKSRERVLDRPDSPDPVLGIMSPTGDLHERFLTNTKEVHKDETVARAVVHEKVIASVHNIITTQITRNIHTHEIRQHIQPVIDKTYLPERHWIQTADGKFVEVDADEVDSLTAKYAYAMRVHESVSAVKIECDPYELSQPQA